MDIKHPAPSIAGLDLTLKSVALKRLVEEVTFGGTLSTVRGYNRTHNRHNR
ncbi:YhhA family cyclophane-containing RiPP [Sphingopyxis lindanitolerans]|uniref:YhhA family cyclophane-containing RiPP n=1 Tax=Sphingopyxis lindanitolerans TaxID=2054227 RepID=UPI001304A273|nr:YhhA family cyclophane-containing RiPP [Sphingopyxis lindanitolerans]